MKQQQTTKQPLEVDGIVHFNSLKVGDQFRFTTDGEHIVRTISQIGRTEIYCPIDGSNTMGHSKAGGEEVYLKSDRPVIKLTPVPDSKEGLHTQGEWKLESNSSFNQIGDRLIIRAEIPSQNLWEQVAEVLPLKTNLLGGTAKANAELIVKAVNERKALLDSHRELKRCLEMFVEAVDIIADAKGAMNEQDRKVYCRIQEGNVYKECKTAINNAKNI